MLEFLRTETCMVQEGLRVLGKEAYPMRKNLEVRVRNPELKNRSYGTWDEVLDSRTMWLYTGLNEHNRPRFKIDHNFDLSMIVDAPINEDGSISIDEQTYLDSLGTEFMIVFPRLDIKTKFIPYLFKGVPGNYAIRVDKVESLKAKLDKKGRISKEELEEMGGFKINTWLKPEEVVNHDGWLELFVGMNNASEQDYVDASKFLREQYVPKAKSNHCFLPDFSDEKIGMRFGMPIKQQGFVVRPWFLSYSSSFCFDSDALSCTGVKAFDDPGYFLV